MTKAFFAAQSAKYNMWGSLGRAGIWGTVTWFGVKGVTDALQAGYDAAGDNIATGNITVTKSDDPVGGGEGSSVNSDIGGQAIVIGSGKAATDKGIAMDAEKGIGFTGDSNMDADGQPAGTTGINLNDDDGNNNSGRLF